MSGPVLPGAVLGILGGGQLGRMTAMAARALGYGVAVLDPDPACAARAVADRAVTAGFDDPEGAAALARMSDVVTFEIERLAPEALQAAARHAPVRPAPEVLRIVQDRARQKAWLAGHGFPLGGWLPAADADAAEEAARRLGGPVRLKLAYGGYDGRGQARAATPAEARAAFLGLGGGRCVVEAELALELELSVMVARRPSGQVVVYPAARNWHEAGILTLSVLPGPLPPGLGRAAEGLARALAVALELEGLLAIELFVVGGELLVNELSPRTHNTYHASETACATSQFEQLVRAVCDLPLGDVAATRPTAIGNLLGDLWLGAAPPDLAGALAVPGVSVRLYGKAPRPGRKLGHLLATGASAEEALARVARALQVLEGRPDAPAGVPGDGADAAG
jgi:5-(carboxyamino)imidazole ribonucleotide synthase